MKTITCFTNLTKVLIKNNLYSIRNIRYACTEVSHNIKENNNPDEKLIKVAIIGVPNAGKSTFINNLINHRICPTSRKVHTTRATSKAIYVKQNTQLILFDTPGLVSEREIKKHNLESSFTSSQRHSIQHANMIGVIQDVSNKWTRNVLDSTVLSILNAYPKVPSFLVLNKIDLLKSKRVLLDLIKILTDDTLKAKDIYLRRKKQSEDTRKTTNILTDNQKSVGWPNFSEVFLVSSMTGDGFTKVMDFILSQAKPQSWEYTANEQTDQKPESIIVQSVRAKLLDFLPQEIPYLLNTEIEFFSEEKGVIYASVIVICPTPRLEKFICGANNGKLRQITEQTTSDLVETFSKPISLTISTITIQKKEK